METRLRTGSCFYSTCLSPEFQPILPDLINSTPGSSVNFHPVDIYAKSCVSSVADKIEDLTLKGFSNASN